uniref:Uncharacterized protein n=1 Tax=Aegilops tauschii subsp. strangulata TaxID=200361 RepID=A0A453JLA0_AEGTS
MDDLEHCHLVPVWGAASLMPELCAWACRSHFSCGCCQGPVAAYYVAVASSFSCQFCHIPILLAVDRLH